MVWGFVVVVDYGGGGGGEFGEISVIDFVCCVG